MKGKLSWLLVTLAIAVSILTACGQKTVPAPTESIRDFSGEPNLTLEEGEPHSTAFGEAQAYFARLSNGDRVRFETDVETGEVIGFFRYEQPAQTVVIDLEEAQATALACAKDHYNGFDEAGLESIQPELIDHGDKSPKFYFFWWIQTDPTSGAFLPNEVRVRVNAETGQVDSYASLRVQVTVSTQPQTDEQSAHDVALNAVKDLPGAQVVDATLAVSTLPVYEPNGEQALLWQVVVEGTPDATGYTPGAFVFIDAQSGEVVHIEPFA